MADPSNTGKAVSNSKTKPDPGDLSIPQDRQFIPHLPHDPPTHQHPHSLQEFRDSEGRDNRRRRLKALWLSLPEILRPSSPSDTSSDLNPSRLTFEQAEELQGTYDKELLQLCQRPPTGPNPHHIGWKEFKEFAQAKEVELWHIFHDELDLDRNGKLEERELQDALSKAGIKLSPTTIPDFILSLSSEPHSHHINFADFRDFFILLPRKVSPAEIYRYYEVQRYLGEDGRGAARVNMEGDVSLSAEDRPPIASTSGTNIHHRPPLVEVSEDTEEEEEEQHHFLEGHTAMKFLLAGGVAGAVSRTCTAPFDRLKIFLITRPPELGGISATGKANGLKILGNAITRIYAEGGVLAFWTGNGLSVAKIFPESAIKFFAYESSKRAFAKYWDKVEDPREISGFSRFLSGGLGGISSQLSIYPIETLKTQMMSNTEQQKRTLTASIRHIWSLGGVRAYYRGLTIGLVGVFP
ncbi:mitochondrial carrier domain-containing protein [Panaeolus papilionaceus]|nr:mitochondrial carrier domain-containing protein [Panaeolus papilionaceus]